MLELSPRLRELKRCFIVPVEVAELVAATSETMIGIGFRSGIKQSVARVRAQATAWEVEAWVCGFSNPGSFRKQECEISAAAANEILRELEKGDE